MIENTFTLKHWVGLVIVLVAILIASIKPLELESFMLHQVGTLLMLIVLFISFKRLGLDFLSYSLYLVFLLIHISAAHYLYSYVPYGEWTQALFHFDLNHVFGWKRNMYDRLVHFAYGFLLYPFFYRCFQVWLPEVRPFSLFLLVLQFVMASSMAYELVEWGIALGMSPEAAENYNGQQGDIWDAHKDMLIATIGAIMFGLGQLYLPKYFFKKTG